jgi:hypothetical protein
VLRGVSGSGTREEIGTPVKAVTATPATIAYPVSITKAAPRHDRRTTMHRIVLCGIAALAIVAIATGVPTQRPPSGRADAAVIVCHGRTAMVDTTHAAWPSVAASGQPDTQTAGQDAGTQPKPTMVATTEQTAHC